LEAWQPWWLSQEARRLGARGTAMVSEVVETTDDGHDFAGTENTLPLPPQAPLPALSALLGKKPSKSVAVHLLDLLYSYCLAMRLYNGSYMSDAAGAAQVALDASAVLTRPAGGDSLYETEQASTPSAWLLNCVERVDGSRAGQAHVPRVMAVGLMSDVARVLFLGRSAVILALTDLSRILDAGRVQTESSRAKKGIKKAQLKLVFFLSYANEMLPDQYVAMALETQSCFEGQRLHNAGE
jgi:hypothetical protein